MRLFEAARDNGLIVKQHVLSWDVSKRGTRYNGVASNSMSAWFFLLVVAAPIFRYLYDKTGAIVHLLPHKLQELVSVMYSWPRQHVEGRTTVGWDFRNQEHHVLHHHAVASRAIEFLDSARDV